MSSIQMIFLLFFAIQLAYGLKCKKGTCTNGCDVFGKNCKTECKDKLEDFEDIECPEDNICYKEHEGPYIEVETMKAGCINKKTGMRDPFMMGWTLHGDDVPKGEKIDEYLNKACLEKELDTGSAVGMKGDPKPFKACFCDTPLCNSGNLPGICGMTLFLIGLISKLF